jgi:hypothetical protein
MKFGSLFALATAPLAIASKVQNAYPDNVARGNEIDLDAKALAIANGVTADASTEIVINPGSGAATTTINQKVTVTQTVTVGGQTSTAVAPGATHTVTVGGAAGLAYSPSQLDNIPIGDTVVFEFQSKNHTVTQSAFNTPCKKLEGGMDSGFQPNPNNTISPPPQVAMQVMVSTPLCKFLARYMVAYGID